MAKKNRHHSRGGFTLPLAVVAGMAPGVMSVASRLSWSNPGQEMAREASRIYLGFDNSSGQFNFQWMKYGLLPAILGVAVHKFVGGTFGINRALGRMNIPLIRL